MNATGRLRAIPSWQLTLGLALLGLGQHIDTGSAKTAEEGMAWMLSDNGKSFVHESSEAWGAAAIAGGEDAAAAKAAVSRTTAAFTGS